MKQTKRWAIGLLTVALCLSGLAGCQRDEPVEPTEEKRLSVNSAGISGLFSPFYSTGADDRVVTALTQLPLLTVDREGAVIFNGIEGETREYNGTAYTYTGPADLLIVTHDDGTLDCEFKLRQDVTFSDGTPMTADDVIFTMYVLCDPTYDGPLSFASLPIVGLNAYRAGVTPKWRLILSDTPKTATTGSPDGYYTGEEAVEFWTIFNAAGDTFAQDIVKNGIANGYGTDVKSVAAALGYDLLPENAIATDLFLAMVDRYAYDISENGVDSEKADMSFEELLLSRLTGTLLQGVTTGVTESTITGIQKVDDYTVRVTLQHPDARMYQQFCLPITPKHYYGNAELYDYEQASFGFVKGDLGTVRSRSKKPMGAGPYTFVRMNDGTTTLLSNKTYYGEKPKVGRLRFLKTSDTNLVSRLENGMLTFANPVMGNALVSEIMTVNGGVLNGDVLHTQSTGGVQYGYLGMSADGVKVGTDGASEQSKYLRRALALVFSFYRNNSVNNYSGGYATVTDSYTRADITETALNTETAPFVTDIHGTPLGMTNTTYAQKQEIVKAAVLAYLRAAGYTVTGGKVTAAPAGAKCTYEVYFVGDEQQRHPAYAMLWNARKTLEEIGITLVLRDWSYDDDIWDAAVAEKAEIWCATWDTVNNPDAYSLYFSGDATHAAGGLNRLFDIDDARLNATLLTAQRESDASKRQAHYEQCFDIVREWAVEVPLYCQESIFVYRVDKVNGESIPPDVTPAYPWWRGVTSMQVQ